MNHFYFIILFLISSSLQSEVCEETNWKYTGIDAIDISMSSEGDLYVIGVDHRIYVYDHVSNSYSLLHADNEIPEPARISVNSQGVPFVVANCGEIFYLTYSHHWEKLPGCARDISVGRGGEVWKVGCEEKENGGYAISQLSCDSSFDSPIINTEREYVFFRKKEDTMDNYINYELRPREKSKRCTWNDIEGEGLRIAVGLAGQPYIIAPGGIVMKYENNIWTGIYGQAAVDIDISNEGVIFTSGADGKLMRSVVEEMGTWITIEGVLSKGVAVGPFAQPVVISYIEGKVMTTSSIY